MSSTKRLILSKKIDFSKISTGNLVKKTQPILVEAGERLANIISSIIILIKNQKPYELQEFQTHCDSHP